MGNHRVSILIPCYQQAHYLPEAVESVLAQTGDLEIIIVNDGSTDATREVAQAYVARRPGVIKLVEQPNRGLAMARGAGLAAATGRYLVLLDADDTLEPGMVETCVRAFRQHPDADLVVGDAWSVPADHPTARRPLDQAQVPRWPDVLEYNPFGAVMAVMARSDSVRRVGGLAIEGLRACEDWDLWIRMIRCDMKVVPVRRRLGNHRERRDSLSRDPLLMLDSKIKVLDWCVAEDPRLVDPTLEPVVPITREAYARLRNGAVLHGLGLALGLGAAASTLDALLERFVPGDLDPDYCAQQFAWGWLHGQGVDEAPPPRPVLDQALTRIEAFLRGRACSPRLSATVAGRIRASLYPRRDLAWVWRGLRWRLRRVVAAAGLGTSVPRAS